MAKTIIQTIGPLYGESVNGTVFGRPNGSIYVPPVNVIALSVIETYRYVKNQNATTITICNSTGGTSDQIKMVAQSQDSQNYMGLELATDSDFTDVVATRNFSAGNFNNTTRAMITEDLVIESETTYYLRAILFASTGVAVSVSDTIEVVGYVA